MKTSNINYFFSVSSEYRFDVEETISKLLLLENLLKFGKLKEREKTTAYDDVRFYSTSIRRLFLMVLIFTQNQVKRAREFMLTLN